MLRQLSRVLALQLCYDIALIYPPVSTEIMTLVLRITNYFLPPCKDGQDMEYPNVLIFWDP